MKHIHLSMRELSQIVVAESHRGKKTDELVKYLRGRGWPEQSARKFIENTLAKERAERLARQEAERADDQSSPMAPAEMDNENQPLIWAMVAVGMLFASLLLLGALPILR